jgi:DNA-binding response OmpR family regulator
MRVLVIEDNHRLAALLRQGMLEEGWQVAVAHDGRAGLSLLTDQHYDAIVLDWMLPELDGLGVLGVLRREGDRTPVLMLTARDAVEHRIAGLDAGADDYLVKPFALDELLARLRALVRRSKGAAASIIEVADLEVDTVAKTVRRAGQMVQLSAREFAVLECLAQSCGRVVSRDYLLERVYQHDGDVSSNVIDVYVSQLRRKIDRGFTPKLIHTRRGFGYVLEVAE